MFQNNIIRIVSQFYVCVWVYMCYTMILKDHLKTKIFRGTHDAFWFHTTSSLVS